MYYIEIKDNEIIGKSYNSFSEGMIEVEKKMYDLIKSVPAKIKRDSQGKIIDVIPLERPSESELPKKPTSEELESQIEGLQSAMAELTMMMKP